MQSVPMFIHYVMRDYKAALADFEQIDNPFAYFYAILAAILAQAGLQEKSRQAVADFEARKPRGYDVAVLAQVLHDTCRKPEDKEHWLEGFRKAGFDV